jgi:tripartite-type tricarboxylate transporter receptor subunit TctC
VPMTLVGRPDFPPNTLAELISYAKENGEQVLYAHAGIGAASQLCGMLLMQALETQFTTVPYKGTAPALTDLMGGQVDFMCDQTTNTTNPIKAGSIKAYATLTDERLDALPDVPTAAEAGLQGIEIAIWHGLYAPAGTPDDVIAKLSETLAAALADANVVQRFAELGTAPVPPEAATPQALQEKLLSEIDRWKPVIQTAGVYAEE